jgi:hypothetical protein
VKTAQLDFGLEQGGVPAWHVMSACELYRYELGHRWAEGGSLDVFAACNPSKATKDETDHTATKTIGFSKHWGSSGRILINACALRSTDPDELLRAVDPVGPENDNAITRVLARPDIARVVVCWGDALPRELRKHAAQLLWLITGAGKLPLHFGFTSSGEPRHPARIAYDTPLQAWPL